MGDLTPKQKKFVQEYLVDLNATQAAIRAGYSEATAGQIGGENLKKLEIKNAIAEGQADLSKRVAITQEEVVAELAKLAMSNIKNYLSFDDNGVKLKKSSDITEEDLACVSEVTSTYSKSETKEGYEESGTSKLKLHSKEGALDKLLRHLGGYVDKGDAPNTNVQLVVSPEMLEGHTDEVRKHYGLDVTRSSDKA